MLEYDPFSDQILDDPFPVYRQLRDEQPAYFLEEHDCWALSRFEDVWMASQSPQLFKNGGGPGAALIMRSQLSDEMLEAMSQASQGQANLDDAEYSSIHGMNPPDHTKLRKFLTPHFTKQSVAKLEPMMRKIVTENLAAALPTGRLDVLSDLGLRLSVQVACEIIGLPAEDGPSLSKIVQRYFGREQGYRGMPPDAIAAAGELRAYLVDAIRSRRASTAEHGDVFDRYLSFELDGQPFDDERLAGHLTTLVVGATETLPKVVAGGVLQLHRHPDQRAALIDDPSAINDAFTEILRYEMPTQFLTRIVAQDTELHGQTLREGQGLMLLYRSANRDDREFEAPDTFDIDRKPKRILSFGHGTHVCLGQHAARLEAKVLFEEILAAVPDYAVVEDEVVPARSEFVAGYTAMPIVFAPR